MKWFWYPQKLIREMVRAPQAIQWSCWRTNTVRRTRPTPEGEARNGMQPGGAVRWCFFHQILWKFYGNSIEIYESRRVPWHFHRFPYAFQTLRENMWECHGLFLLSKSRKKKGRQWSNKHVGSTPEVTTLVKLRCHEPQNAALKGFREPWYVT